MLAAFRGAVHLHISVASHMHLNDLKDLPLAELVDLAIGLEIDNASRLRKHELIFAILKAKAKRGEPIFGDGTLEVLPDGFGFLRSPETA